MRYNMCVVDSMSEKAIYDIGSAVTFASQFTEISN